LQPRHSSRSFSIPEAALAGGLVTQSLVEPASVSINRCRNRFAAHRVDENCPNGRGTRSVAERFTRLMTDKSRFERPSSLTGRPRMDTTTLLIIVLIVLVLGGGGWYGRGRWY
jgi:hypothetical protein